MFGPGIEGCWYEVLGVAGLELSGDLRFQGPGGMRRTRHDRKGRPYVAARRKSAWAGGALLREWRVLLHRPMTNAMLGRELAPAEMVCHRDDDRNNNWRGNLYLDDARSNAADSVCNGRRPTGERHPAAKLSNE
jgi:hypothetical protein